MKPTYIRPVCTVSHLVLPAMIALSTHQEVGNKEQAGRQMEFSEEEESFQTYWDDK